MNSLVGKFMSAWLHPAQSMEAVKSEGESASIKSSVIFVVVMALIAGLITTVIGLVSPAPVVNGQAVPKYMMALAIVLVPLASLIGSFVAAFILWILIAGLLKGTGDQYKTTYRMLAVLAAFSPVSTLLSAIPKVGSYISLAINLWAVIVMIQGIVIVMGTEKVRTWISCVIFFGLLFVLGYAARVATQQQLEGNPGFNNFEGKFGANDDLGAGDDEELNKKLDELSDKAKADVPAAAPATETQKK